MHRMPRPGDGPLDWEKWVQSGPKHVRNPGLPRPGANPKREAEEETARRDRETELAREMLAAAPEAEIERARRTVAGGVRTEPLPGGAKVVLDDGRTVREQMRIETGASGALRLTAPGVWLGNEPSLWRTPGHEQEDHGLHTGRSALTAVLGALEELLSDAWARAGGADPGEGALSRAACALLCRNPEGERDGTDDGAVSKELVRLVRERSDPELQLRVREGRPLPATEPSAGEYPVTLDRYNLLAAPAWCLESLGETNPGALMWAFAHGRALEEIRHPGQVISMAREALERAGLEPRNWKFVSRLSQETVRETTWENRDTEAAELLNAVASQGWNPGPAGISNMLQPLLDRTGAKNTWDRTERTRPNAARALNLMARALAGSALAEAAAMMGEVPEIGDYVRDRSKNGQALTATTWGGLRRASARWHQAQARERRRTRRTNMALRGRGTFLAWNSLLGDTEEDGARAAPLTDEMQLLEEAQAMDHCVFGYGESCASGEVRIFSILENGERSATTEIGLQRDGTWRAVQTRGRMNRTATAAAVATAESAARRYTEVWKHGSGQHRRWEKKAGAME